MFMNLALRWALSRASEASTWAGLAVSIENAVHIRFNGDFKTAFVHLGLALAGLAAVVVKEGVRK